MLVKDTVERMAPPSTARALVAFFVVIPKAMGSPGRMTSGSPTGRHLFCFWLLFMWFWLELFKREGEEFWHRIGRPLVQRELATSSIDGMTTSSGLIKSPADDTV
jgi:hypothetical protein